MCCSGFLQLAVYGSDLRPILWSVYLCLTSLCWQSEIYFCVTTVTCGRVSPYLSLVLSLCHSLLFLSHFRSLCLLLFHFLCVTLKLFLNSSLVFFYTHSFIND